METEREIAFFTLRIVQDGLLTDSSVSVEEQSVGHPDVKGGASAQVQWSGEFERVVREHTGLPSLSKLKVAGVRSTEQLDAKLDPPSNCFN